VSEARVRDLRDEEERAADQKPQAAGKPPVRLRVKTAVNAGAEVETNGGWSN
jgi:hypothetical protein